MLFFYHIGRMRRYHHRVSQASIYLREKRGRMRERGIEADLHQFKISTSEQLEGL